MDRARVSKKSVAIFLLFLFLFFFFSFGRHIGLLFMGVLNLLKVVNETRVGYCKEKGVAQFFSLSLKPNVLGVWLAKGGRKRLNTTIIQLIINSTRYGINLISTGLNNVSIF